MYRQMFKFANLVSFSGRATRREMFILGGIYFLLLAGIFVGSTVLFGSSGSAPSAASSVDNAIKGITFVTFLVLVSALLIRRVHDQDRPGYFLLVCLVPFIGQLLMVLAITANGTDGENSYGADPRDPDGAAEDGLLDTFS